MENIEYVYVNIIRKILNTVVNKVARDCYVVYKKVSKD